jgi:hypothetical protein
MLMLSLTCVSKERFFLKFIYLFMNTINSEVLEVFLQGIVLAKQKERKIIKRQRQTNKETTKIQIPCENKYVEKIKIFKEEKVYIRKGENKKSVNHNNHERKRTYSTTRKTGGLQKRR